MLVANLVANLGNGGDSRGRDFFFNHSVADSSVDSGGFESHPLRQNPSRTFSDLGGHAAVRRWVRRYVRTLQEPDPDDLSQEACGRIWETDQARIANPRLLLPAIPSLR
jgi:hypothetical protein